MGARRGNHPAAVEAKAGERRIRRGSPSTSKRRHSENCRSAFEAAAEASRFATGDAGFELGQEASLRLGRAGSNARSPRLEPRSGVECDRSRSGAGDRLERTGPAFDYRPCSRRRSADQPRQDPSRRPRLVGSLPPLGRNRRRSRRSLKARRGRKPLYYFAPKPLRLHHFLTLSI